MTISYPTWLPPPLRDGYDFNPVSPMVRSELVTGRTRQRRAYSGVPTVASVQWLMTDIQARMFEAWWEETLISGTQWFECPLKTPLGGMQTFTARFDDIYQGPTLVGVDRWRFKAQLELRKRPLLDPGWIGVLPDYIQGSDIFDKAINVEWPL